MRRLLIVVSMVSILIIVVCVSNRITEPRFSCRLCKPVQVAADSRLSIVMISEGRLSMIDLHPDYTWVNGSKSNHYGYIQLFQAGDSRKGNQVQVLVNPKEAKALIDIKQGEYMTRKKTKWKKYYCEDCYAQLQKLGSALDAVLVDRNSNQLYRMDEEGEITAGSYQIKVTAIKKGYQIQIEDKSRTI